MGTWEAKLPLWAKPNAGLPEFVDGKTVFRQTPAHIRLLAQEAPSIVRLDTHI